VAVADRLAVDLVVVGSKGLNPAGHYVIGSVAERVLLTGRDHHVLVIRTTP
jgi:nucleotide-binding universal stress UspA family protein